MNSSFDDMVSECRDRTEFRLHNYIWLGNQNKTQKKKKTDKKIEKKTQ